MHDKNLWNPAFLFLDILLLSDYFGNTSLPFLICLSNGLSTKGQRWQCRFGAQHHYWYFANVHRFVQIVSSIKDFLFNTSHIPQWHSWKDLLLVITSLLWPVGYTVDMQPERSGAPAWNILRLKRHGLESRRQKILSWCPWVQSLWSKWWKNALSGWLMARNLEAGAKERLGRQGCATWIHNLVKFPSESRTFVNLVTGNFSFLSCLVSNPGTQEALIIQHH